MRSRIDARGPLAVRQAPLVQVDSGAGGGRRGRGTASDGDRNRRTRVIQDHQGAIPVVKAVEPGERKPAAGSGTVRVNLEQGERVAGILYEPNERADWLSGAVVVEACHEA